MDNIITLVESFQAELDKLGSTKEKATAIRERWCVNRPTLLACVRQSDGATREEKLEGAKVRSGAALEQHFRSLMKQYEVPVDDSFQDVLDPLMKFFNRFIEIDPIARKKTGL